MLEQLRNFVRDNVNQILKNPSVIQLRERVNTMLEQTAYFTNQLLLLVKTEVPRMWSKVEDLLQFTYVTALEKISDIMKAIETSQPIVMIKRTLSELLKTMEEQLEALKMWLRNRITDIQKNPMLAKVNNIVQEVRGDFMRSYGANRNVTMRLAEDMQKVLSPYMAQAMSLYVQVYEQLMDAFEKFRELPEYHVSQLSQVYTDAANTYDFIVNASSDDIYARLMDYTKKLYISLKTMVGKLYENTKSISGTIGKDTLDAVVGALNAMEKKLIQFAKMVQAVVDVIKKSIENIRSGKNAEEELRTMMKKLLGSLDLPSTVSQLCAKDARLCELVQETVDVHKELVNKYLVKL